MFTNTFKKIVKQVGIAVTRYSMIKDADHIIVGVSGGKDSWTLLKVLLHLQKKAPVNFTIEAVKVDYPHSDRSNHLIAQTCREWGVECTVLFTDIKNIIKNHKNKKSHCAFCARLRRGFIYSYANRQKSSHPQIKIALGHHRDDLLETFFLNMFFTGQLKSMAPVLITDDLQNTLIRPLCLVPEELITAYLSTGWVQTISGECPFTQNSERQKIKQMLNKLTKEYPDIKNKITASLANIRASHLLDTHQHSFFNQK